MATDKLLDAIEAAGLSRLSSEIQRLVRPSIRMTARPAQQRLPAGSSKLGGSPDLPRSVEWPTWDVKQLPLTFIAQINLSDVARYDNEKLLPHSGILYFFYEADEQPWGFDPANRGCARVLFYDGAVEELGPRDFSGAEKRAFAECGVEFGVDETLPPWDSPLIESLNLAEGEKYWKLLDKFHEEGTAYHRLFGYPDQVQNAMQLECQLVTHGLYCGDARGYEDPRSEQLAAGADDWELLLQIDSDEAANMMWGDAGRIYFWIRRQELRTKDFENVWLILQCY